jgi:hypothetical protein
MLRQPLQGDFCLPSCHSFWIHAWQRQRMESCFASCGTAVCSAEPDGEHNVPARAADVFRKRPQHSKHSCCVIRTNRRKHKVYNPSTMHPADRRRLYRNETRSHGRWSRWRGCSVAATGNVEGAAIGGAVAQRLALIGRAREPGDCIYRERDGRRYIAPCP